VRKPVERTLEGGWKDLAMTWVLPTSFQWPSNAFLIDKNTSVQLILISSDTSLKKKIFVAK